MKLKRIYLWFAFILFVMTGCSGSDSGGGELSEASSWNVEGQKFPIVSILAKPESDPNPFIDVQVEGVTVYFLDIKAGCNDYIGRSNNVTVFFPKNSNQEFSAPITVEYDADEAGGEGGGSERESGFPGELALVETSDGFEAHGWVKLIKLLDFDGINLTLAGTFVATYCSE